MDKRLLLASVVLTVLVIIGALVYPPKPRVLDTTATSTPNPPSQNSTVPTRSPRKSNSALIDPKDVVEGDQYGVFNVTKTSYTPPTTSYPDSVYSIDFSGTTTITGVIGTWPDMGCFIPLEDIATSTRQQLPHTAAEENLSYDLPLDIDQMPNQPSFSFDKTVPGFHPGDTVEVTINHFVSAYIPKECGSDYGVVTSLRKI